MIYATKARTYLKYLMKGCSFVELQTSGDNDLKAYLPARCLMKPRSIPVFVVGKLGQAWSLRCFAATPEQCQKNLPHLCVVVSKSIIRRGKIKMHEASQILYFPNILTSYFDHLCSLATVLKADIMLQRALRRLAASELPSEDLLVTMAPCILPKLREETEAEDLMEDMSCPCIVCFHHPRSWRWSKCEHATDGPALVCHWCKKRLLQAQRDAENIQDRRAFVLTRCIICNRASEFKRVSAVMSKADSAPLKAPAGFGLSAQSCSF